MKKAIKDFDTPPAILVNAHRRNKVKQAVADQSANHITGSDYSPAAVKTLLEAIYNAKCSYCESTVKQVAALQVEHYRPKKGVAEDASHKGYYWLSVEWTNLLLGCPACNGQGAKGNKFPVAGTRVVAQNPFGADGVFSRNIMYPGVSPLSDERPLLLNPELDDPDQHLKYTAFGLLNSATVRGKATIGICDLNRDSLLVERQRIVNQLLDQFNIIFAGKIQFNLSNEIVDTLLLSQLNLLKRHRDTPTEPYTSFVAYLLKNPAICVYPRVEAVFKPDVKRAFAKFRKQA